MSRLLFQAYANTTYWKVELLTTTIVNGESKSGIGKIVLKTNQPPYNGSCSVVTNSKGYALETNFTINCTGWIDDDGFVSIYEYFGKMINFMKINI